MQKFAETIKSVLDVPYTLLRSGDSDKLMCGKVWRACWKVEEHLKKFVHVEGLETLNELWTVAWKKLHHPVYCLAYVLMPEYHNVTNKQADKEMKEHVDVMLKRYYPDPSERGAVRAAIKRFEKKEGCFKLLDGDTERDIWTDAFLTNVTPWDWWDEVAAADEPELCKLAKRILRIGVSSSCNERVFSGWGHILGKRRTRMRAQRQKKQIYVYTNQRVLKTYKRDLAAACDSASDDSSEGTESEDDDIPLAQLRQ